MSHNPLVVRLSSTASLPSHDTDIQSHSVAEHHFLQQDPRYPFAYTSSANVWRGDADTLFRMSRRTKRDIQDFILGACVSRNKDYNERTKPTGSKFIYVLDLDDSVEEQPTLCVLPNVTASTDLHNVNDVQGREHFSEQTPSCRTTTTNSMKSNSTPGALRRRGSTVSFTKMLASANKKDFPHDNRELDSDTDSDSDSDVDSDDVFSSPSPPRQTKILAAIEEASEEEEEASTSLPIAEHVFTRYCRDPNFSGHPTCNHRTRSFSYGYPASDAETDLQERFMLEHDGEDSAAHYLNWRALKWEYGETMVHGPSLLRKEVPAPVSNPAEQLTLRGRDGRAPTRRRNRYSEEDAFKIDRIIGDDAKVGVWLADVDESEELASQTSTLSEKLVGTERGTEADMAGGDSPARVVRTLPEEELLKILNTSHDEFFQHYENVQRRQKAARSQSSVAASPQVEIRKPVAEGDSPTRAVRTLPEEELLKILSTSHEEFLEHYHRVHQQKVARSQSSIAASSHAEVPKPACYVPVGAPCVPINTAPESLQHLVLTTPPSTPEVSPTQPTHPSSPEDHSHRASVDAAPKPAQHVVQNSPLISSDVSPPHLPAPLAVHSDRVPTPPAPSPSETLSSPPSIFTHSASVTTKPSQESVGEQQQQQQQKAANPLPSSEPEPEPEPEPRLSRRLKAKKVTKKCLQTVREKVQRGVGGVSSRVKKMRKAMRDICGA